MTQPLVPERQICAVPVCHNIARKWFNGEKYCYGCYASVYQASYTSTLSAEAKERALYRTALRSDPPAGVTLPEPLSMPPRSGWRSRP
jgi:hypothetical protein